MAQVKFMKQATLSSLKGVVVYEDLSRHKSILEFKDQEVEDLLSSLSYLSQKKPCKEALVLSDIGTAVKSLCSHPDPEVSRKAKDLLVAWNNNLEKPENCQPTFEVRYDLKTQHFRKTAMTLFQKELGDSEDDRKLVKMLEKEVFHVSSRLVSTAYRKTVRKIVFLLKNDQKEKELLKRKKISVAEFVKKHKK